MKEADEEYRLRIHRLRLIMYAIFGVLGVIGLLILATFYEADFPRGLWVLAGMFVLMAGTYFLNYGRICSAAISNTEADPIPFVRKTTRLLSIIYVLGFFTVLGMLFIGSMYFTYPIRDKHIAPDWLVPPDWVYNAKNYLGTACLIMGITYSILGLWLEIIINKHRRDIHRLGYNVEYMVRQWKEKIKSWLKHRRGSYEGD